MVPFAPLHYALILVATLTHYSVGKRLKINAPLTGTLVGLTVSSLIVAILANVCAGLIRPYLWLSLSVFGALTAFDLLRERHQWRRFAPLYAVLAIAFWLLFAYFNPNSVYFTQRPDGHTIFNFDYHFSYKAVQATEMLQADYYERLRVANHYPMKYAMFHFFGTASQAIVQAFVPSPGLFSFLAAQFILALLILLSFAEMIFLRFGFSVRNVILWGAWFVLGMAWFWPTINLHLSGTMQLTAFALIQFVLSLFSGRYRENLLYGVVLMASNARMPLVVPPCLAYVLWSLLKLKTIRDYGRFLRSFNAFEWAIVLLCVAYNAVSLTSAPKPFPALERHALFQDDCFDRILAYRFWGYWYNLFIDSTAHQVRFWLYDNWHYFTHMPHGSALSIAFGVFCLAVFGLLLYLAFQYGLKPAGQSRATVAWVGLIALLPLPFSRNLFWVNLLFIPYFALEALLFTLIAQNDARRGRPYLKVLVALFVLQLSSVLIQYSPIIVELKRNLNYAFDIVFWGTLALGLFSLRHNLRTYSAVTALTICSCLLFPVRSYMLVSIPPNESQHIDITPLLSSSFKRTEYVGPNNFLTLNEANIHERLSAYLLPYESSDVATLDAYASILGAYLPWEEGTRAFQFNTNRRFVWRERQSP